MSKFNVRHGFFLGENKKLITFTKQVD